MNLTFYHTLRPLGLVLLVFLTASAVHGQVSVQFSDNQLVISNQGFLNQRAAKGVDRQTGRPTWIVFDNVDGAPGSDGGDDFGSAFFGNEGEKPIVVGGGYQSTGGEGEQPMIISGGYQSIGGEGELPIVIGAGYQDALDHLVVHYGAVVQHDELLGLEIITIPDVDDPIGILLKALSEDVLPDGTPLISHFRIVEIGSLGVFDEPEYDAVKPQGAPFVFPNDPLYRNAWNVSQSALDLIHWHPAPVQKAPRIGVIDSGVSESNKTHRGLGGVNLSHVPVAHTFGSPVAHGLAVLSLLADANNNAEGAFGLVGAWDGDGCYAQPAVFTQQKASVLSYNAGDFAPTTWSIARAIRQSIEDGVDVLNLSLRTAYSPVIAEAVEDALGRNMIIVAAAGNYSSSGAPKDRPATFPANLEGVISVGASGRSGNPAKWSANQGVDIFAPGEDIIVGGPGNVWYHVSGTSFAAPHVTATAAVMKAMNPEISTEAVLGALQAGARGSAHPAGTLNALAAVNESLPAALQARTIRPPQSCGAAPAKAANQFEAIEMVALAGEVPQHSELMGNYPNPFNPSTTIRFYVSENLPVNLAVYNMLGQQVLVLMQGEMEQGFHEARFSAGNLPSGVYLYHLQIGDQKFSRTMTLLK